VNSGREAGASLEHPTASCSACPSCRASSPRSRPASARFAGSCSCAPRSTPKRASGTGSSTPTTGGGRLPVLDAVPYECLSSPARTARSAHSPPEDWCRRAIDPRLPQPAPRPDRRRGLHIVFHSAPTLSEPFHWHRPHLAEGHDDAGFEMAPASPSVIAPAGGRRTAGGPSRPLRKGTRSPSGSAEEGSRHPVEQVRGRGSWTSHPTSRGMRTIWRLEAPHRCPEGVPSSMCRGRPPRKAAWASTRSKAVRRTPAGVPEGGLSRLRSRSAPRSRAPARRANAAEPGVGRTGPHPCPMPSRAPRLGLGPATGTAPGRPRRSTTGGRARGGARAGARGPRHRKGRSGTRILGPPRPDAGVRGDPTRRGGPHLADDDRW